MQQMSTQPADLAKQNDIVDSIEKMVSYRTDKQKIQGEVGLKSPATPLTAHMDDIK